MSRRRSLEVGERGAGLSGLWRGLICLVASLTATTAEPASARLVRHLDFTAFKGAQVIELVDGRLIGVQQGFAATNGKGTSLQLTGHPDQALELGVVGFDQPASFALWIKRAASPAADPRGVSRPEYQQEQERGQGRLLARARGTPEQRLAGAMRVGPAGLEVWAGRGWVKPITAPIPAETWVHLTVVFDAQMQATGYLNGRRSATVRCGFDGREIPLVLASSSGDRRYGFPFAGAIDDVRLYQGVLEEAEISALAAVPPSP